MTTTLDHHVQPVKGLTTQLATQLATETKLTGPAWYLNRHRVGALNRSRDPFNVDAWLEALNASDLHEKDKETGEAIAETTDWYGQTIVNRYDLAALAGVTRVATITARTKRLEDAGFITTKQRYNQSSITRLTVPLGSIAPHHEQDHPDQFIPGALMPDAVNLYDSVVSF